MIHGTSTMDQPVEKPRALRRLVTVGLPVLLLLAALASFMPGFLRWMGTEQSVDLSRIRIATVTRGDLERDLQVQGKVIAASRPTAFSPADGIVSLRVRAGEVVERGQILASIDSPELRSRLKQERSTLASAEGELQRQVIAARQKGLTAQQSIDLATLELEAARRAMKRAEQSRQEKLINAVEYETAEDSLQRATMALAHTRQDAALSTETLAFETRSRDLDVQRQRIAVEELERQVAELAVRSPVSGLCSRVDVEERDAVVAGQPLVAVVDLSALEIELTIPESYADEVGLGTPAVVREGSEPFEAELRSVSPEVQNGQVRAIVAFSDRIPEGLRQNQRVSVRLILESRPDVLKTQRGPFLEAGGGRSAFVVDGDTAQRREIRTGASSVTEVEIVDGLAVGERIIISDTARYGEVERLFLRE